MNLYLCMWTHLQNTKSGISKYKVLIKDQGHASKNVRVSHSQGRFKVKFNIFNFLFPELQMVSLLQLYYTILELFWKWRFREYSEMSKITQAFKMS